MKWQHKCWNEDKEIKTQINYKYREQTHKKTMTNNENDTITKYKETVRDLTGPVELSVDAVCDHLDVRSLLSSCLIIQKEQVESILLLQFLVLVIYLVSTLY